VLGSSIHIVMRVEEGRESCGVQSKQCKLGKCNFCFSILAEKEKKNV
jgi:hypothetical protein